jgi:hypothetical protein
MEAALGVTAKEVLVVGVEEEEVVAVVVMEAAVAVEVWSGRQQDSMLEAEAKVGVEVVLAVGGFQRMSMPLLGTQTVLTSSLAATTVEFRFERGMIFFPVFFWVSHGHECHMSRVVVCL